MNSMDTVNKKGAINVTFQRITDIFCSGNLYPETNFLYSVTSEYPLDWTLEPRRESTKSNMKERGRYGEQIQKVACLSKFARDLILFE